MFTTAHVIGAYVPIVLVSWSIDYAIGGLDPIWFHATNLLLHLINVGMVFLLVKTMTNRVMIAFITALLFGMHPMHVEAVAWVTARKDLMYTLFFVTALWSYLKYLTAIIGKYKWWYLMGCFALFLMALLSKGTAVILPLVLLAFDYWYKRFDYKRLVLEKLPFIALSIIFALVAIKMQNDAGAMKTISHPSWLAAIATGCYGYLTYIIKVIIPYDLSVLQPYTYENGEVVYPFYYYLSAIPLIGIVALGWIKRKRWHDFNWAWLFFFITLIPVIQVLPFGASVTADRFTYLPYLGLFYLVGFLFDYCYNAKKQWRKPMITFGVLAICILGICSHRYTYIWKNSETLWTNVIAKYPLNTAAYLNRSAHRIEKKQFDLALLDCNKGIELNPKNATLHHNLGIITANAGDLQQSISHYSQAITLEEDYVGAYLNRGIILQQMGKDTAALNDFQSVVVHKPEEVLGHYNTGLILKKMGRWQEALPHFDKAAQLKPTMRQIFVNKAKVLVRLGKSEMAINDFEKAIELGATDAITYTELGNLYLDKRFINKALDCYNNALFFNKDQVDALINRGLIQLNIKQYDLALSDFNTAEKLTPNNHLIAYNKGLVFKQIGNMEKAKACFYKSIELMPQFHAAREEYEKLK